jgi:hypothetical protein
MIIDDTPAQFRRYKDMALIEAELSDFTLAWSSSWHNLELTALRSSHRTALSEGWQNLVLEAEGGFWAGAEKFLSTAIAKIKQFFATIMATITGKSAEVKAQAAAAQTSWAGMAGDLLAKGTAWLTANPISAAAFVGMSGLTITVAAINREALMKAFQEGGKPALLKYMYGAFGIAGAENASAEPDPTTGSAPAAPGVGGIANKVFTFLRGVVATKVVTPQDVPNVIKNIEIAEQKRTLLAQVGEALEKLMADATAMANQAIGHVRAAGGAAGAGADAGNAPAPAAAPAADSAAPAAGAPAAAGNAPNNRQGRGKGPKNRGNRKPASFVGEYDEDDFFAEADDFLNDLSMTLSEGPAGSVLKAGLKAGKNVGGAVVDAGIQHAKRQRDGSTFKQSVAANLQSRAGEAVAGAVGDKLKDNEAFIKAIQSVGPIVLAISNGVAKALTKFIEEQQLTVTALQNAAAAAGQQAAPAAGQPAAPGAAPTVTPGAPAPAATPGAPAPAPRFVGRMGDLTLESMTFS